MSRGCSASGFTLIEVLVAMGLVSVLIAGAAGMLTMAGRAVQRASLETTATLLTAQKAEQLLAAPRDALSSDSPEEVDGLDAAGQPTAPGRAAFVRRWVATSAGSSASLTDVIVVRVESAGGVSLSQVVVVRARREP